MIAFIPVSRFRIDYQVASGRPYSVVERFLLDAVADGTNRLDALVTLLGIHRRVVIEGLVTLMQAGWLELHANATAGEFAVTPTGKQALVQDDKLPPTTEVADRTSYLVMEGVRGQIARGNAVRYQSRGGLREVWAQGVLIPKSDTPYAVEPGLIRPLLWTDSETGEYIRAVGPINIVRDSADFVVVDVDVESRRLIGIPSDWEQDLLDELIDRVNRKQKKLDAAYERLDQSELRKFLRQDPQVPIEGVPGHPGWTVSGNTVTLISGATQHLKLLLEKLEQSRSCVVIVTPTLSQKIIKPLMAPVLAAIRRGVSIEVVWGWRPDPADPDQIGALPYLTAMQGMASSTGSAGRLQIASSPSGSNACLLLADADARFESVIGSNPWLGSDNKDALSVRLTHPGPVGRLCSLAADLLGSDPHLRNSSTIIRLQNGNAELDSALLRDTRKDPTPSITSSHPNSCRVKILHDREHYTEFQRLVAMSRESVKCSSTSVRGVIPSPVARALGETLAKGRQVILSVGGMNTSSLGVTDLEKNGAVIQRSTELTGNWLVVDGYAAVVTSLSWLGTPQVETRPRNFDLGLSLESTSFTEQLSAGLQTTSM